MALTKEQLAQLKPGSKVYYAGARGREKYTNKVESVGNKYIYLENRTKWDKQTGKQITEYTGGELYESEQTYNEHVELNKLWDRFRLNVS